jgi:hypothetical protein
MHTDSMVLRFAVSKAALGQAFLLVLPSSTVSIIPPMIPTNSLVFNYLRHTILVIDSGITEYTQKVHHCDLLSFLSLLGRKTG